MGPPCRAGGAGMAARRDRDDHAPWSRWPRTWSARRPGRRLRRLCFL